MGRGKEIKITITLTALIAVGYFLMLTSGKRHASLSPTSVAPISRAMRPKAASITLNAEIRPDNLVDAVPSEARALSQKSDSSAQETQQLVLSICAALSSDDAARHDLALGELMPCLIKRDAEAAGGLAEMWAPGPLRAELLCRVAQEWAKCDPAAAIAWAANLKDYAEMMTTLQEGCIQISQSNPEEAIAIATRFNSDDGTLESIAQFWARKDLPAVLEWARRQSQGEQRDRLMARIAFVKAETLPVDAAVLVANEIAPGPTKNEAFISVLHQWGLRDRAAAAAWIGGVSEESLRARAITELVGLN